MTGQFKEGYNRLIDRFEFSKRAILRFEEITDNQTRHSTMNAFLYTPHRQDNLLIEFDEKLWCSFVDYATVYEKDDVRFTFKDGTEIQA